MSDSCFKEKKLQDKLVTWCCSQQLWKDRECQSSSYKTTKFTQRAEQKFASWWCSPKFFSVRRTVLSLSFPKDTRNEKWQRNWRGICLHLMCTVVTWWDPERCHQSQLPTPFTCCLLPVQVGKIPGQGSSGDFCPSWGKKAKEIH